MAKASLTCNLASCLGLRQLYHTTWRHYWSESRRIFVHFNGGVELCQFALFAGGTPAGHDETTLRSAVPFDPLLR